MRQNHSKERGARDTAPFGPSEGQNWSEKMNFLVKLTEIVMVVDK